MCALTVCCRTLVAIDDALSAISDWQGPFQGLVRVLPLFIFGMVTVSGAMLVLRASSDMLTVLPTVIG